MKRSFPFILICTIGVFAIFSSTIAKNPVLPILAQQVGASSAIIGLIAAASTVTGILTSLPAGLLSDQRGRKPLLIASGIVFFTAPLLYFAVFTPLSLALVRVYHGLATAVFGPVAMAYIADLSTEKRGERLGYFSSAQLVGRSVAPAVGGAILALGDWRWVYVVCAAAGLLTLLGIFLLPRMHKMEDEEPIEIAAPTAPTRLWAVVKDRTILIASLARSIQYFAFGAIEVFLPLYALSVGVNKFIVGLLFTVQIGFRTITRPLTGIFSDKKGRKLPIVLGLILIAVSVPLFALTRSPWLMLFFSAVFGLGFSIASGATSAMVADQAPVERRGAAMGFMSMIMDIGQALGPILLGFLLTFFSYLIGFISIAILTLIVLVLFVLLAKEKSSKVKPANGG
jgi:MFS family permease